MIQEGKLKKIVKKNQVIITSLAILIAIAGYLNYSKSSVLNQTLQDKKGDIVVNDVIKNEENENDNLDNTEVGTDDLPQNIDSENKNDTQVENEDSANESETNESTINESTPGEAVLTNVGTFSANAKLQREQLRAKNKEILLDMINNQNLSESQKSDVTNEMLHMTEIAELENEVETLLEAKGFTGAVVTIDDSSVDVVVSMIDVTDKQRAQIEDVVKRKTNIPVSNIIITPISVEN